MSGDPLIERDRRCVWHPWTQHAIESDPLPVIAAQDALLKLADGRVVIDAISSWWTCLHGHGHPRLLTAMHEQAARLDHVLFAGCTHPPAVDLAEALIAAAPAGLSRVFFSDNGSTAVEVALKIVRQHWVQTGESQRTVFVALEGAYHGDTFGAMAVGERSPFFAPFEALLFTVRRCAAQAEAIDLALAELGSLAAGLILEPRVQGAGGMLMHSDALLRSARASCDRHGVPLIADEVMTGFGRTGSLFATAGAGITPDLLCLAKGLTGGVFPLAATLATERLFDSFLSADRSRALLHGHSFTAHPVGCAIARASLELCLATDVPARLDAIGQRIERGLELPDVRRRGGIVAVDLPAADAGYHSQLALRLREAAIAHGVLLRPLGTVLYSMPPACTTTAQCDQIAATMNALARLA